MERRKRDPHIFRLVGFLVLLPLLVGVVMMTAIFIAPIVMVTMPIFIVWSIQKGGAVERHHQDDPLPARLHAAAH